MRDEIVCQYCGGTIGPHWQTFHIPPDLVVTS
jgi:hypothetical protein